MVAGVYQTCDYLHYLFMVIQKEAIIVFQHCFTHRRVLIYIVVISLIISGCATEENAWQKAADDNTIESYKTFLKEYPEGEFAEKAKIRIEIFEDKLSWEAALENNTIQSYENYLSSFPRGAFTGKANSVILDMYAGACVLGVGIDKAAEFNRDEPGPHKLFIRAEENNGVLQNTKYGLPNDWIASCISDLELVVLIVSDWKHIDTCIYSNSTNVHRLQNQFNIAIREAKTGRLLDTTTLTGSMPEKCPQEIVSFSGQASQEIRGAAVPLVELKTWLSGVVNP
jgi:hypothetical protein